jgi:hypothetical protein
MIDANMLNSWAFISGNEQRKNQRRNSALSIQVEYVECMEHELENVRILYPYINDSSACPLCEARVRVKRLEAQYERAMMTARDLADLVLGKDRKS